MVLMELSIVVSRFALMLSMVLSPARKPYAYLSTP